MDIEKYERRKRRAEEKITTSPPKAYKKSRLTQFCSWYKSTSLFVASKNWNVRYLSNADIAAPPKACKENVAKRRFEVLKTYITEVGMRPGVYTVSVWKPNPPHLKLILN